MTDFPPTLLPVSAKIKSTLTESLKNTFIVHQTTKPFTKLAVVPPSLDVISALDTCAGTVLLDPDTVILLPPIPI